MKPGGIRGRWGAGVALSGAALLIAGLTSSCSEGGAGASATTAPVLHVVTAVAPLAQAVTAIGQSKAIVTDVVPTGTDPLTYTPTPDQQALIRSAGLVIEVGPGFQPAFNQYVTSATHVVAVQTAVRASDPYVWLDPTAMGRAVTAIAKAMEAADPPAARLFAQGASGFADEVSSDSIDYQSTLATCPTSTIFTADGAFSAMAQDYGLTDRIIGTQPPTPATAAAQASRVRQAAVSAVFGEPWVDDSLVTAVATASHAKRKSLDTLVGPPAGGWRDSKYIDLLEGNLGTLSSVLGCDDLGTDT